MGTKLYAIVIAVIVMVASAPVSASMDASNQSLEDDLFSDSSDNAEVVKIKYTYHLTPDEPGSIRVDVDFDFPKTISKFHIDLPNNSKIISKSGFIDRTTEWNYTSRPAVDSYSPSISYNVPANVAHELNSNQYHSYDAGDWALVSYNDFDVDYYYHYQDTNPSFDYSHEISGDGVAGNSIGYLGNAEVHNRTINSQEIYIVIPTNVSMDPEESFTTLSFVSNNLDSGPRSSELYAFTGPGPLYIGWASRFQSYHLGNQVYPSDAFVQDYNQSYSTSNKYETMVQEYVHTLQMYRATDEMKWIDEGTANYYEYLYIYHLNYTDFSQFYGQVSTLEYADTDLTRPAVWDSYRVEYVKGTRVIAGLDVEIRERTDGERSFEEVFRLMNQEEDEITYDRFAEILETVTGDDMRPWLDRYVKGDEVPPVPKNSSKYPLNPPYLEVPGQIEPVDVVEEGWRFETGNGVTSLAVEDGTVFVGSGDNVYALNPTDDTEQWRFQTFDSVSPSPPVVDGTVYVGSQDNNVYALNASDGTEKWRFETGGEVYSSPEVVDGTVFVGSYDHNVYALNASDGTEQWRFQTGGFVGSSPKVVDGSVYVGSQDNNVYALDASDGTEKWRFETGDEVYSSPAVRDETVFVGSYDKNVYALNASDGTEQWRFETDLWVSSSPAVVDGTVYVGSQDDNVYALNTSDGTEQWRFQTGDGVISPTVLDGTVYVGSQDNNVYALNASDGTEQWRFETGGAVSTSPAVVDGTVYVGSQDNKVYKITDESPTITPTTTKHTTKETESEPDITLTTAKQTTGGTESEPGTYPGESESTSSNAPGLGFIVGFVGVLGTSYLASRFIWSSDE